VKTLRRALAIVALLLLIIWLAAQLVFMARRSQPAPAAVATEAPVAQAPDELPREFVIQFHDAMWRRICTYLESERGSDESEQKAHQVLRTSLKKAKETVLTEAARRYQGSDRVKDHWREQLDQEEDAIWDKADVSGEGRQPDKR
jgi:hypothetical protein